jgi:hypothetical protein
MLRRYCPRCGSPMTTASDATPDSFFINTYSLKSE